MKFETKIQKNLAYWWELSKDNEAESWYLEANKFCRYIAKKHNISYSELIMAGFDSFRENDIKHANNRYKYHEERLLHWRQKLIQIDDECNKKTQMCNTVREVFLENNRQHIGKRENMNWLETKVDSLLENGIIVSKEELYEFCTKKK